MEKFALVLTGGTIGSVCCADGISADEKTEVTLLKKCKERGGTAEFEVFRAENLLSENLSPASLEKIARSILAVTEEKFKGIIVTAGTDNLGYLSVYLAFALKNVKMPIAMISSQFVLEDARENGTDNLLGAVTALRVLKRGIYVINRNLGEPKVTVFLAVRLRQAEDFSGDFASENGIVGWVQNGEYAPNTANISPVMACTVPCETSKSVSGRAENCEFLEINPNIFVLHPSPITAPFVPKEMPDAVLIHLYHSGTAAINDANSVLPLIAMWKEQGVPVYAAPAAKLAISYETTNRLIASGVRFLYGISPLAAEVKLALLFSKGFCEGEREDLLAENICGEIAHIAE